MQMEAMAAIGGSIISLIIDRFLNNLTSMDLRQCVGQGQVLNQLNKWENMLKKIHAVIEDAEEKQMTSQLVQIWLMELKDLAYDVEDVLDELSTEVLQRKLMNKKEDNPRPNKVRRIISSISAFINPRTIMFNVELVSKIDEITARLDEIMKQKNYLNLVESSGKRVSELRKRPASTSLVNESKVYGREKDKKNIIELLQAEENDADVCVIPILGMGGVGKTTLAQLVYSDVGLEFDFKAWVCVGEDFDVVRVTKTVLLQFGDYCAKDEDLNSLQVKLKQKLFGKKYLVILDDVWTRDYEQWTVFLGPFVAGMPQSRIIITTRLGEVSSMVGTVPAYALKELSYYECLAVFAQHALGATDFSNHLDLEEIGKGIVRRCKGLPLAAKALGGLLRGKCNRSAWEDVFNSEIWELPDNKSNVLPVLRLSYLYLPPYLKQCFAYCAIFPKDFEFDRNELVLLWMAEGFLCHPKEMKQVESLGHRYFDDLVSRSFFQRSSDDQSLYIMHDLMHDLARFVSRDTCFHLVDVDDKRGGSIPYAKIRHSSFTSRIYDVSQRFEVFDGMKDLRTFLALPILSEISSNYLSGKVVYDLVPRLKCLRVLSLAGYQIEELPISISALKHLRCLNLSYSAIRKLPESVCELLNLQTLRLRGCEKLVELPRRIDDLINLKILDISGTGNLQQLPLEICNLKSLCMLTKFIVGRDSGLKLSQLKKLTHLQGLLQITALQNVTNSQDADLANLKEKSGLHDLQLEWSSGSLNSRFLTEEAQVLNSLRPHQNLSRLSIRYFGGDQLPPWVGDHKFTKIVQLKLWSCHNIKSLPPLGQLPSLRELSIEGMDRVKKIDVEFYGNDSSLINAFVCLETLMIDNMLNLEQWSWPGSYSEIATKQFPILRKFTVRSCPKLVEKLPSFLPSLEKLNIQNCPKLVALPKMLPSLHELYVSKCQKAVLKSVSAITTLVTLKLERIFGLVSLDELLTQPVVSLKHLEIVDCGKLMYLWHDGTNSDKLACLKHLIVCKCQRLVKLVEGEEDLLPCNLEELGVYNCKKLRKLPSRLHSFTSLSDLSIFGCQKLVSFPEAGLPSSLMCVDIHDCDSLGSLPKCITLVVKGSKPCLEILHIECCPSLKLSSVDMVSPLPKIHSMCHFLTKSLEPLHWFRHLTVLTVSCCPLLESLPETISQISSLISLTISRCDKLRYLPPQMQNLISLLNFEIDDCRCLLSFPECSLPPNLTTFKVKNCKNLRQPMSEWGIHRLSRLKRLEIEGTSPSTNFVSFPDDDGLLLPVSVTFLFIVRLDNLESISKGLHRLACLQDFLILNCPKLQSLPREGFPATLGFLVIQSCPPIRKRLLKEQGDYWPIIASIPYVNLDDGVCN